MPYKSKEDQRTAAAERMRRMRSKGVTTDVTPGVTPCGLGVTKKSPPVTPDVTPYPGEPWNSPGWNPTQYLAWYIQQPVPKGKMPHLEALQRIAGSLGKHAGEVRFGVHGFTMEEIGGALGTLPPLIPKD